MPFQAALLKNKNNNKKPKTKQKTNQPNKLTKPKQNKPAHLMFLWGLMNCR